MAAWLRRLLFLGRSRRFVEDLDAELAFHLDLRARSLEDGGLPRAAAERRARMELGPTLRIREESRDVWIFRWMDELGRDLRYALRGWRRQPAFTAAVVITLALGIGANTAIFSVVDALLLKSAPFGNADRLVLVYAGRPSQGQPRLPLSYPNFLDLRARSQVFEALAGWTMNELTLTGGGEPEHVQSALVTANLFNVLDVRPAIGRTFAVADDRPGTAPVVVIGHTLWTRRFGRDPHVLGKALQLDGEPYTIVGVLPEDFRFASYPHETEIWLPFGVDKFTDRQYVRGLNSIFAVGRLKNGATVGEAYRDVAAAASSLERDYPDDNRARLMFAVPLEEQASVRVRWALVGLSIGVVLVLLVACVNVMNLLLGRASARQHELAVRSVLGGSRRRIAVQLLVDYVALALAGGAGGLVVALVARDLLVRLPYNSPDLFTPWAPSVASAGLNARVLMFTFASSLAVGLLVGLLPALQTPASDRRAVSAGEGRISGQRRAMRIRGGLVVAEIALAVVLLTAMGLMISTVVRLRRVDPGFSPDGLTAIELNLPASRYPTRAATVRFYGDLLGRLRATPGVAGAGAAEYLPFSGLDSDTGVLFDGQPIPLPHERPRAHYRSVTEGYFETMGIPVVGGRLFGATEGVSTLRVALLNETAARQFYPDDHAIGRHAALDFEAMRFFPDRPPVFDLKLGLREVVGVLRDVRHSGLTDAAAAEMYVPFAQRAVRRMTIVVRSTLPAASMLASTREIVSTLDPAQPIGAATTLPDLIEASISRPQFNMTLMTAFGLLALGLAAIGIYGVMSYFVALRTREIGIHVAIGATRADVFRLVTRQMAWLSAAGIGIGLVAAFPASDAVVKLLAAAPARDPLVFGAVAAAVVVTAAMATAIPALRALRIDPARALRDS